MKKKQYLEDTFKTPNAELTPRSLTVKTVHEYFRGNLRDAKKKVARKLFLHNAMAAAIKFNFSNSSVNHKRIFKHAVSQTLAKYRPVRPSLSNYLSLKRGFRRTVVAKEKESNSRKKLNITIPL